MIFLLNSVLINIVNVFPSLTDYSDALQILQSDNEQRYNSQQSTEYQSDIGHFSTVVANSSGLKEYKFRGTLGVEGGGKGDIKIIAI